MVVTDLLSQVFSLLDRQGTLFSLNETVHFTLYLGIFFPTCSVAPYANLYSITINLSLICLIYSLLPFKSLELVQNLNVQFMLRL